jgi:hypothetical protein
MTATGSDDEEVKERQLIEQTGMQIRKLAEAGGVVVLGRAAAVVLADHPDALHVRLDGAPDGRVEAAMSQHGIDHDAATAAQRTNDKVRSAYVTYNTGSTRPTRASTTWCWTPFASAGRPLKS